MWAQESLLLVAGRWVGGATELMCKASATSKVVVVRKMEVHVLVWVWAMTGVYSDGSWLGLLLTLQTGVCVCMSGRVGWESAKVFAFAAVQ